MKIVLPANERSMEKGISVSFGRAPYFLVYDTDTQEGVFIENNAAKSQGGAGIKAAQTVVDTGAKALLTPRCGENAADVLKAANIEIYQSINDSLENNISTFNKGGLKILSEIHAGFHGKGGE